MDRPSGYKTSRPELKFAHTSPPQPSPELHHLKHPARRAVTLLQHRCCRGASARSAAAEVVDDGNVAVLPPLSLSFPPLTLCRASPPPHAHARAVSCTGTPSGARRSQSTAAEEELLAADEPVHPRPCNLASKLPRATAVDLRHPRILPSPLGEPIIHHRVAGVAAPPKFGRRRCLESGPLDPDPTATYRFRFRRKLLSPEKTN